MSKNLNNTLIKEDKKLDKDNKEFIENILSENSFLLNDSKNKCCNCNFCSKIPLFICFFMIGSIFLIILLGSFLIIGIFLMKYLYREINDLYFTNFVIDPIINKKTNSTQAFNIKNEVLDSIYLESKLINMQIAAEFNMENLQNSSGQIISEMTKHEDFKCIRTDNSSMNICEAGQNDYEDNYFLYINNNTFDGEEDLKNLFSSLTYYLRLFENNLEFNDIFDKKFINIKEYFFYFKKENDDNFKILLTYCNNWDTENGLIENIFKTSNFNEIINKINENASETEEYEYDNFEEFIVNNDFNNDIINEFNYLKVKTFIFNYKNINYTILVGLRLDSDSIDNLFNKQNSNMTTIAPISKLTTTKSYLNETSELHLLFNSKYFYDFFEYGLKNTISTNNNNEMMTNEEYAQKLEYENTNITNFFNLLNYASRNGEEITYLYNENWKEDFITTIKLIVNIIGEYNLSQIICNEEDINYYYNILCELCNENNINGQSEIIFNNIKNIENDAIIEDLNKTSYYIHNKLKSMGRTNIYYNLVQDAFTDLQEKKSNTKIFYYNSSVNNKDYNSIEVLNISTYNSLKEEFIKEMEDIEFIVILIRVGFICLFLIISIIKIILEISRSIKRINSIISLKDMLFNKTEVKVEEEKDTVEILSNEKDNVSKLSRFSEKAEGELLDEENMDESLSDKEEDNKLIYDNMMESEKDKNKKREKWSKAHFYDKNFMDEGNKLIIQYTYNRLKNIFENMDFFQNEKFAEKLMFLKRRYKLNEQYEDKDDCELSSDIYQAISKISMINMDDIYYNVYYNQSYALNQSFKMFKSILDSSINKQSIILRNNKYISFGRILRFIYFIKKEKIQKIIEIIYGKDLKYKSKKEDDKNINNIDNNIDNNIENNIFNEMMNNERFDSPNKNYAFNKGNLFPSDNN